MLTFVLVGMDVFWPMMEVRRVMAVIRSISGGVCRRVSFMGWQVAVLLTQLLPHFVLEVLQRAV